MLNHLNKSSELIPFLTHNEIPFVSYSTMSSKMVEFAGEKYYLSDLQLKGKELGFLSTVRRDAKDYFRKNGQSEVNRSNIAYTYLNNLPVGHYENMVEIDISAAYWNCAYKIGIITKSTFEKGLTISKAARLVALGALASNKACFVFDGKELKYRGDNKALKVAFDKNEMKVISETDKDSSLAFLFFQISFEIGIVIKDVYNRLNTIKPDGCIGFWVDAVFVDRQLAFEAVETIASHGYDCKVKGTKSLNCIVRNCTKTIWMTERTTKLPCENFNKEDIRVKPFIVDSFQTGNRKKSQADRIKELTLQSLNKFK